MEVGRSLWHSFISSVSTLLNIVTVVVLTITVTLVAAIHAGATGWMKDNINENRLARRITFGKSSAVASSTTDGTRLVDSALFSNEDLQSLRTAFPAQPGASFHFTGAWGWNDVQLWFRTGAGEKDPQGWTSGRTVAMDDPLLSILDLPPPDRTKLGQFSQGDGAGQIIVSQKLLRQLGYDLQTLREAKERIAIFYEPRLEGETSWGENTQRFEYLQVAAVCDSLPYGDYLITEPFSRSLRRGTWNPTPRYRVAFYGPMPGGQDLAAALDGCQDLLKKQDAVGAYVNREDGLTWMRVHRPPGAGWTAREWQVLVEDGLLRRLRTSFGGKSELRAVMGPAMGVRAGEEPFQGFINASVDTASVEEIPAAVDALGVAGYRVKNSVRGEALLFMQISKFGRAVLVAIIVIVSVLSAISIGLSFYQAVQRKTPEIGIFKAFGAGNLLVMFIYLTEAVLIWLVASLVGFGVVKWLASAANATLAEIIAMNTHRAAGSISVVRLSREIYIITGAGSLALCCLATLAGAFEAVRLQPARALKGQA